MERLKAFLIGFGSVFSVMPRPLNHTYFKNDEDAIRSDWEAVGNDMKTVLHSLSRRTVIDNQVKKGWRE